LFYIFLN